MLRIMNDKAKTCLSCSLYVREQKMKYLANEKITNTAAGKIQTYLTCNNKLWHMRSTFYKLTLYSSSRPFHHQFPMLLFTLLTRNATITVSQ